MTSVSPPSPWTDTDTNGLAKPRMTACRSRHAEDGKYVGANPSLIEGGYPPMTGPQVSPRGSGFKTHAAGRRTSLKACLRSADDYLGATARSGRSRVRCQHEIRPRPPDPDLRRQPAWLCHRVGARGPRERSRRSDIRASKPGGRCLQRSGGRAFPGKAEAVLKDREAAAAAGRPKTEYAPGSAEYQALHPEWKPQEE